MAAVVPAGPKASALAGRRSLRSRRTSNRPLSSLRGQGGAKGTRGNSSRVLEEAQRAVAAGAANRAGLSAASASAPTGRRFGSHTRRSRRDDADDGMVRHGGREHSNVYGSPVSQRTMSITRGSVASGLSLGTSRTGDTGDLTFRTTTVASGSTALTSRTVHSHASGRSAWSSASGSGRRLRPLTSKRPKLLLDRQTLRAGGVGVRAGAQFNKRGGGKRSRRKKYMVAPEAGASATGQRRRRRRDRRFKKKKGAVAKWMRKRVWAVKRYFALRQQAKVPVRLGERAAAVAQGIDLTQDHLRTLRSKFNAADYGLLGNITYEEYFEFIGEPRSTFTDALYDQILEDKVLDLDNFVIVTVLYCMYSRQDILKLVFSMFDKDSSGTIDEGEFMNLCSMVNGASPVYPGNFKNALEQFDINDDGLIDFQEFLALNKRFPLILFPAFRLQSAMQEHTLGEKEWLKVTEAITEKRRVEAYKEAHGGMLPPKKEGFARKVMAKVLPFEAPARVRRAR